LKFENFLKESDTITSYPEDGRVQPRR